ncbi:MAG: pyridoxal-phosphate-dependent aminotransferase family protein [Alphaproteobacteria bacterium]
MAVVRGRQFFQNPGPTNIPDRILRAMDRPAVDFVQKDFRDVIAECIAGLKFALKTEATVVVYSASGHGAWEGALVNVLSPGDSVLVCDSGYFSEHWATMAKAHGIEAEILPGDWRRGVDPEAVEARLRADSARDIKAVLLVHNETSTGVANRAADIRRAIDAAGHPALYMIDTISSLMSFDFRMDEWGVDVAVGGSQKGLMLPPGLSFNGISRKALATTQSARCARSYWDWRNLLTDGRQTGFSGTAAVHLWFGLQESVRMLQEEGHEALFARHHRLAEATRRAIRAWSAGGGPELYASDPRVESDSVSAVLMPEGHDAEAVRRICLDRFNLSLGGGLGALSGRVFRIGHMGDLNEPMILGTIASVEAALAMAKVPHGASGTAAAIACLASAGSA